MISIIILTISIVAALAIGIEIGKGAKQYGMCPYSDRYSLESWCRSQYPDTPPSFFAKRNKTYLISLWHTRPRPEYLPIKIYTKGE